jgi:hypothetical protein
MATGREARASAARRGARLAPHERAELLEEAIASLIEDEVEFAPRLAELAEHERLTPPDPDDPNPAPPAERLRAHVVRDADDVWRAVDVEERAYANGRATWRRRGRLRLIGLQGLRWLMIGFLLLVLVLVVINVVAKGSPGQLDTLIGVVGTAFGARAIVRVADARLAAARRLRQEMELALTQLRAALRKDAVAPLAREFFPREQNWAVRLQLGKAPGLADLASERFEVSTGARRELAELLRSLRGSAIGISGPRGAGKTTLIASICSGRTQVFAGGHLGVHVSTPVNYDARDFVVYLLSRTCEEVIGDPEGLARMREQALHGLASRDRRRRIWLFGFLGLLFGAAALLAALGGVSAALSRGVLLGIVAAGCGLVAYVELLRDAASRQLPLALRGGALGASVDPVRLRAMQLYCDAKLQQSYTSTWSGSLDLPMGASLGAEGSMSWAQVQLSLPELVEQLRGFLREVAEQRETPIVIGIDELDKMRSSEEAQAFLNGVKSIFGVAGVHFLISVSQDAMSSFERRGLPFRDVFDSSFDEVVEARYLTFDETQRLLRRRMIGTPDSFEALCHCLSGAVPRDVIRVARTLVAQVDGTPELSELTTALVADELRAKAAATALAVNACERSPGRAAALAHVAEVAALARPDVRAEELVASCRRFPASAAGRLDERSLAALAAELSTFVRYCSVLLTQFGPGVTSASLEGAAEVHRFEAIAGARQGFAFDHTVAWARLDKLPEALATAPAATPVAV